MSRFRLRTLFLLVVVGAFASLALDRYFKTRPPKQNSYSAKSLKQALSDGRPVLVAVDADWALNPVKESRFKSPNISQRIREMKIEVLAADWTKPDPSVRTLLQSLNEDTVPTLALFSPDDPTHPILIPSLASDTDILKVIEENLKLE